MLYLSSFLFRQNFQQEVVNSVKSQHCTNVNSTQYEEIKMDWEDMRSPPSQQVPREKDP